MSYNIIDIVLISQKKKIASGIYLLGVMILVLFE